MDLEISHWYALTHHSRLSHGKVHDLIAVWRAADPENNIENLFLAPPDELSSAGLAPEQIEAVAYASGKLRVSSQALEPVQVARLDTLTSDDSRYPALLAQTLGKSRPPLLFTVGNLELLGRPTVSFTGSREPAPEALDFTRATAGALARRDIVVVTGFAEGVDRAASGAALDAGGATILVLAQGLLTFTRQREALGAGIAKGRILIVSAFRPRAGWDTPRAMARNAIITAFSRDTIAGQAHLTGGAWETSRMALNQGKRLWAPRRDDAQAHEALARFGARLVDWPSDGFEEWVQSLAENARLSDKKTGKSSSLLTEPDFMQLLREGSPADIHDALGLTGHLLSAIIEGRQAIGLHVFEDLEKIKGVGPRAVQSLIQTHILPPAAGEMPQQLNLFPDIEEFPGWKDRLSAPWPKKEEPKRPEPTLTVSDDLRRNLMGDHTETDKRRDEESDVGDNR